jgi:hypothetical protein
MTDLVRYEVARATLVKHPEFADILNRKPRSYFFRKASSSDHDWVAAFSL